jgi:hypothetical protein
MSPFSKSIHLLIISTFFLFSCSHIKDKKNSYKHTVLPTTCLDQLRHYYPVEQLTTITSLNSKPKKYSPINAAKNIIKNDFNNDKFMDYIFIELIKKAPQDKARLVICTSSENNHMRRLPNYPIHINTKPDFQSIYERIEWKNNQLILSTFKSEHNWGSDDEIAHYRYDTKRSDFILVSHELVSSSGDGLRSDTYEFYDYDHQRYKSKNTCGNLEEGCQSSKSNGGLVIPKQRSSLFLPSKPYLRKIPQS